MSDDWSDTDVKYMRDALLLAEQASATGEVPVGAVVVASGEVVGRGRNRSIEDNDPSGHAEIVALRDAGRASANHRLTNATLYVTLEPCAMCAGALIQARVQRLVFGAYDDRAGAVGSILDLSSNRKLNHRFEVNGGLLKAECSELLSAFFAGKRS
jgi:tRNA(adenine34) deaminase